MKDKLLINYRRKNIFFITFFSFVFSFYLINLYITYNLDKDGLYAIIDKSLYNVAVIIFPFFLLCFFFIYKKMINKEIQEIELIEQNFQNQNKNLEQKLAKEVAKNLNQTMQLCENRKLADLGSMLGHIIHQWRQPLNYISIIATNTSFKLSIKNHDLQLCHQIKEDMDGINMAIQNLNGTLNTFRNFLHNKKEITEFKVQDAIGDSLILLKTILHGYGITLENKANDIEPIYVTSISRELTEVIVNIVNNAKDVLLENEIKDPWIKIALIPKDDSLIITIEDNGGGIPANVMPNIFKEYFTTKDSHNGTGLGLYMSKMIIEESLGGVLEASNTIEGALFTIELPYKKQLEIENEYNNY